MVKYSIKLNKDHGQVAVHYDLSVPVGGVELIAEFSVYIDGKNVIEESASGNTRFFGTVYAKIDGDKDIPVAFSIASSTGFSTNGDDVLRAGHPFDDAEFSN